MSARNSCTDWSRSSTRQFGDSCTARLRPSGAAGKLRICRTGHCVQCLRIKSRRMMVSDTLSHSLQCSQSLHTYSTACQPG